jgi:ribosomal protein S24E
MEIRIISDIKNPLFNRREIQGEMESDSTPKREEVLKVLSEKFSVDSEDIKIKFIRGNFGSKNFSVSANIYDSKEDKDKWEIKKKKEAEKKIPETEKVREVQPEEQKENTAEEQKESSGENENKEAQ